MRELAPPEPSQTPALVADEAEALRAWLDVFWDSPNLELPRPPTVALEILELSQKPTASLEEVVRLLEREPLMAGRVLKLSNSALYGSPTPVTTLKAALIRLGMAMVRDVVMEAALALTVMRAPGFEAQLERLRRHSTAAAWVSRFVARNTPAAAENAFLVGLFHDVGFMVGLTGLAAFLEERRAPVVLTPARWLVVDALHASLSGKVLTSWKLPAAITVVAEQHHSFPEGRPLHPAVAVLSIAESLTEDGGFGASPSAESLALPGLAPPLETPTPRQVARALESLSLTPKHYQILQADTARVLETLRGQF
jgi:HD-like signal output (HDOD) protein